VRPSGADRDLGADREFGRENSSVITKNFTNVKFSIDITTKLGDYRYSGTGHGDTAIK
jgi:hypothetical protein